jgi:hypothetical protein
MISILLIGLALGACEAGVNDFYTLDKLRVITLKADLPEVSAGGTVLLEVVAISPVNTTDPISFEWSSDNGCFDYKHHLSRQAKRRPYYGSEESGDFRK